MGVFKPSRRINGKRVQSVEYAGRIRMPWMNKPKQVALCTTDKQIAERRLKQFTQVQDLQHEGLPVPAGLWGAPAHDLVALVDEYRASLVAQKRTPIHVHDTVGRILRL